MQLPHAPVIWMAYVSYPVTTAVYLERALRKLGRVITCGPKIGPEIIEQWQLQNMKLPVKDQDLPLPAQPDMNEVCAAARGRLPEPDLYLWVESVPGYYPKHLEALKCPKACYLIDSHLNLEWHVQWARNFDHVFIAQREYVPEFQRHGCRNVHWLPLGCDPDIHSKTITEKRYDVGFVGSVFQNSRRAQLLESISGRAILLKVERCFWDDMALIFSQSRMVFNNAVRNDLNMRLFEVMSSGSFLLTDLAPRSAQDELFVNGEDLGLYEDHNLRERVRYWLIREEQREHIAARAQKMVHQAHTYSHRCSELLKVTLQNQRSTPTSAEWRERSIQGISFESKWVPKKPTKPEGRSIIIPVLDVNPKRRADFEALLQDLQQIEGEVIIIFNSQEAASLYKDHPRIDLWATMSHNVGVSRAWNIGIHMASQPTLFIINSDLRITRQAVEEMEKALWELPSAAIVGPEGSYFGFYTYEDILWFDKGRAAAPLAVDAVSGFLFVTKRELFLRRILQFEDGYTPCFTEEWDIGLQARQAGYKTYIIPLKGYGHEWGVSAQQDRVISYLKNGKTLMPEILARNRIHFWRKWLSIAGQAEFLPAWEPNGPGPKPANGSALLQSKAVELAGTDNLPGKAG